MIQQFIASNSSLGKHEYTVALAITYVILSRAKC